MTVVSGPQSPITEPPMPTKTSGRNVTGKRNKLQPARHHRYSEIGDRLATDEMSCKSSFADRPKRRFGGGKQSLTIGAAKRSFGMLPMSYILLRIACAFISLGVSALAGSALAVAVVEDRVSALGDLLWWIEWTMRGRPLAPGEADSTWMLEIEWKIALLSALMIVLIGSAMWAIVSKLRLQSHYAAALIGFFLSAGMAGFWFYDDPAAEAARQISLIGLIGAIIGVFTRAIDYTLAKLARRFLIVR